MAEIFGKINVLGLGSGLDLQGLLDQLREIEEAPVKRLEDKKDVYETRLTEFDWLNTQILSLKSKALDLSLESNYLTRQVKVSGDAVSARAEVGALTGTYNVEVSQLARKSLWESQGFASKDASVAANDDVLQIAVGEKEFSVLVPAGTTLEGLANLINEAEDNPGVEASVVDTGSAADPYKLILKAKDTGENYRLVVTQELSSLSFEEITGTPNIWRSANYANPEDVVNNTGNPITLTIRAGEKDITIEVPDGTTLSGLKDLINNAAENSSLRAYLRRDSAGNYFIDMRSPESLSVSQSPASPALFPQETENAGESLNAFFKIDDISYQRGSNQVSDIVPGVVFSLKSAGNATVKVSSSLEKVKSNFSSLVKEINDFFGKLREKMAVDIEEGIEGPLYRSTAAEKLIRDLRDIFSKTTSSNKHLRSLFDLGVDFNRDGSITLNEKKLEEAFSKYPEEVKKLLLGDEENGIKGFGESLNDVLQNYLGPSGLIALEQNTTKRQIELIEKNITLAKERVEQNMAILQRQFMALDNYLQQLNDLSTYLEVQFKSISGLTDKK